MPTKKPLATPTSSFLEDLLQAGRGDYDDLIAAFDQLEAAPLPFMIGCWRGAEIATGHPADGLLQASGWYGKLFLDRERVHPLLFWNGARTGVFSVHPKMANALDPAIVPRSPWLGRIMRLARPFISTRRATARLRSVDFRGTSTAAMVYDHLPVIDVFRKIDDQRLLCVMDRRGEGGTHYVFTLTRDDASAVSLPPGLRD